MIEQFVRTDLELLAEEAAPVADLAALTVAINSERPNPNLKGDRFNRYAQTLFALDARAKVDRDVARLFLRLVNEEKVPGWVLEAIDIELIRAAQ